MRAGDVLSVDFGRPHGSEAGLVHPAVVVTADELLVEVRTLQVVPVTSNVDRGYLTDVPVEADGLDVASVGQCHLVTTIDAVQILADDLGNVGTVTLRQLRSVLADLLDVETY
ncbi:MAG: type II toxin-antitoxin system PemK/MazF family toxin [Ilumatobacteraceae bacterium]